MIGMKKYLCLLMICILMPIVCLGETGKVVTNGGSLKIRKNPDSKARLVMTVRNGTALEVLETADGWYHVSCQGKEGYVQAQYVRLMSEAVGKEIYSNGRTVYLHETMNDDSLIVGMINAQQPMTVEQVSDGWVLVSADGERGYIHVGEIDDINEEPSATASQKWEEGILQSETKLYKGPDQKAEVLSVWPKGTGVYISSYNNNWSLVQVMDEGVYGFARKAFVQLSPMPRETQHLDESQYITADKARLIAEKALRKYSGFNAKSLTCSQDTALSADGIRGPMYLFNYTNRQGQYVYAAYVHAYTGKVLYTGDYSGYVEKHAASDLKTAAPATTQAPQWWYDENGNVVWDRTPEPLTGTDIGQNAARSIADRYLASKYPTFSQLHFSRVSCRHATDPTDSAGFQVPYYQFDYFVDDGSADSVSEQLAFGIIINAYTKEIEYSCAASFGEGNG